jgi:hypothetical protein
MSYRVPVRTEADANKELAVRVSRRVLTIANTTAAFKVPAGVVWYVRSALLTGKPAAAFSTQGTQSFTIDVVDELGSTIWQAMGRFCPRGTYTYSAAFSEQGEQAFYDFIPLAGTTIPRDQYYMPSFTLKAGSTLTFATANLNSFTVTLITDEVAT